MSSTSDSALFRLRSATVDFWALAGSWQLSVVLMVTAAFWYALLAIFAYLSPAHVVHNIAALGMFWLLYAALLVNTAACLVTRRIRTLHIGTTLFHLAFFVIAAGFLLSLATRSESTYRVAEGEELVGAEEQVVSRSAPRMLASAAAVPRFRVERIVPQLWRDQLLFTSLEATLGDGSVTRINRPLLLGPATFLRLSGFGYAPRYEVLDGRGDVLESAFVKANVFPPGQRDFIAGQLPFRFYISTGDLNARSFDVAVYRGRLMLARGSIRPGEPLAFEGLVFRIAEVRRFGDFSVVRDAGAPMIFAGFALALAGLSLKLWRRA